MMIDEKNYGDNHLVKDFSGSGFVSGTVKPGHPKRGKAEMETHTLNKIIVIMDTNSMISPLILNYIDNSLK